MTEKSLRTAFAGKRIVIVGDAMIDRYWHGRVDRISPEAPVPVVQFLRKEDRLGGAGNVALNVKALGGEAILCSVFGNDDETSAVAALFSDHQLSIDGIFFSAARKTTVKTRIVAGGQQLLRLDDESTFDLNPAETKSFLTCFGQILDKKQPDAIIFQDYNKGVLTQKVIEKVMTEAQKRGIPTAIDPKKRHFFEYRGATLFKPNLKEVREALPFQIEPTEADLLSASQFLRDILGHKTTMITLSERGICTENGGVCSIWPTRPRAISDVSGAGDTVIAVAAMGLAAGFSIEKIARLANLAGGQVCESAGVVAVDLARLEAEFLGA